MSKMEKHHSEHLDNTKGRWRPALVAGQLKGPDGHPLTFDEIVVISCPACGAPQGIGADDVKIVNGKTDRPWHCYGGPRGECKATLDSIEFDQHQDTAGREHFGRLKAEAQAQVEAAREMAVRHHVMENDTLEREERITAQAKALFPDAKDPAALQKVLAQLKAKNANRKQG